MKPFDKIIFIRDLEGITSKQKTILLLLSTYIGKNEFCFVSLTTLLKKCGLKKRSSVYKTLFELEKLDFLTILPPSNSFKTNRYAINFTKITHFVDNFKKMNNIKTEKERESYNNYKKEYKRNKTEVVSKSPGTLGTQSRYLQYPVQVPTVPSPGTHGTPKYNINRFKRNLKEEPVSFSDLLKAKSQSIFLQNQEPTLHAQEALNLLGKKLSRQVNTHFEGIEKFEL